MLPLWGQRREAGWSWPLPIYPENLLSRSGRSPSWYLLGSPYRKWSGAAPIYFGKIEDYMVGSRISTGSLLDPRLVEGYSHTLKRVLILAEHICEVGYASVFNNIVMGWSQPTQL